MKEAPYIGVTGPTTAEEVRHLVRTFSRNGISLDSHHQPMVGFLVSYKTLTGQETQNRRYPKFSKLTDLIKETNYSTFNTIHYNSRELETLSEQLKQVMGGEVYEDELCRAVQLNIPWPPIDQLRDTLRFLPDLKFILQLSHKTFAGITSDELVSKVRPYQSLIRYTLLDPSGGRGLIFGENLNEYFLALRDAFPELVIGVAGGFTGENVLGRGINLVHSLGTRDISIDAEGGLRDKLSDEYGDDLYNNSKVESYLSQAAKLFT